MNTSIFFSISSYFTGRDKEELSASYSFSSRLCKKRRVWSQYHPTLQAETRRSEELSASYSFSSHGCAQHVAYGSNQIQDFFGTPPFVSVNTFWKG